MKTYTVVVKKTNCKTTGILHETIDTLEMHVKGKPEQGEANLEFIKFLKKHYKQNIVILRGHTSKKKLIRVG